LSETRRADIEHERDERIELRLANRDVHRILDRSSRRARPRSRDIDSQPDRSAAVHRPTMQEVAEADRRVTSCVVIRPRNKAFEARDQFRLRRGIERVGARVRAVAPRAYQQ
jgi:hypothetical protein